MEPLDTNVTEQAAQTLSDLRAAIHQAVVGQAAVIEQVLAALVASGHVLIEGVPGLGKTLLVRAMAQALSLPHARIQFTPDMMPSDITGHALLDPATRELRVIRGPVFTHILLADEINRAPAKTQSALLEVMQEYQVTLEGQTLPLPKPFMVLATQNPVETEGTYPLPEAQLDRFLFKIEIGYPTLPEEVGVVVRATTDQAGDELPLGSVTPVFDERLVVERRREVGGEVDQGHVGFVADRGNHRHRAGQDGPGQRFIVERPQILERAAAARDDDQIGPRHRARFGHCVETMNRRGDLGCRRIALHTDWPHQDATRKSVFEPVENVADDRARR